jgi:hypothetical protein
MHTTTKTTVKMNKPGMMDRNIEYNFSDSLADKTELFKRLCKQNLNPYL